MAMHVACGILGPPPGTEPGPSAVKVQSPKPWAARQLPGIYSLNSFHILDTAVLIITIRLYITYPVYIS